jgi:hypothetical protein
MRKKLFDMDRITIHFKQRQWDVAGITFFSTANNLVGYS